MVFNSRQWPPKSLAIVTICLGIVLNRWILPVVGAELPEIQARGQLIVAVKDNLPPLGYQNPQGQFEGLEIDIARRLAQELLGSEAALQLVAVPNQDRLDVVLAGRVDLTIARVSATPGRLRLVNLSDYYYLDGTGLVTRDSDLRNLQQFRQRTVAVLNGSDTVAVVRQELPQANFVGVDSYQAAWELLEKGSADAFAADNSLLTGWVQKYPQYRHLPLLLSVDALCIVMPKGRQYQSLYKLINHAIAQWKAEGWLEQRIKFWGLL